MEIEAIDCSAELIDDDLYEEFQLLTTRSLMGNKFLGFIYRSTRKEQTILYSTHGSSSHLCCRQPGTSTVLSECRGARRISEPRMCLKETRRRHIRTHHSPYKEFFPSR